MDWFKPMISKRTGVFILLGALALVVINGQRSAPPKDHQGGIATASEMTFQRETFGCRDWDTWQRLGRVVAQGDKEAFARMLYPALATDACRRFKLGDRAFLAQTAVFSGSSCMRPKGETECYWVSIESAS